MEVCHRVATGVSWVPLRELSTEDRSRLVGEWCGVGKPLDRTREEGAPGSARVCRCQDSGDLVPGTEGSQDCSLDWLRRRCLN